MLEYHKTNECEKHLICGWKYDGEYAVYNNLPYEEQIKHHRGFGDPKNNYYSFCEGTKLIAYINLIEKEREVFFGIGVAPEYCDQGYGTQICKFARIISKKLYPGKPVYLEVRTWNKRAVRCYEKAGFRIIGEPVSKKTPIGPRHIGA